MYSGLPGLECYRENAPVISALFIGVAQVVNNLNKHQWHFLLIEPVDDRSDSGFALPQFRRVGTMQIPEYVLADRLASDLRTQEKKALSLFNTCGCAKRKRIQPLIACSGL
jgi:hypothetical protein